MTYAFKCSNSLKNIEDPEIFDNLCGDELSELLCEDFNYINWFTDLDLDKLQSFDMCTILSIHPELIGLFLERLKEFTKDKDNPFTEREWEWVVKEHSKLRIYTNYIFDKSY